MRVPLSWLKDYVDFADSPKGLAEKLTFCGIEVERIETVGADLTGLVVAEVRATERHPNADRLTVCRVFDGTQELQVVCGAPNVQAGGRYPFAPVGATLPSGVKIKAAKLRGVESHGMLCAEDELGVSERHEGLMVLDGALPAGRPLSEVLGGPETILDLEITPNRSDCLGLIGVAREVAALYGVPLKKPAVDYPESADPVSTAVRVEVHDTARCPRYTARLIRSVRLAPSPRWMQQRLAWAGVRPINNVVDVTNYVMIEYGQPLHAFDYALIGEQTLIVRTARDGEQLHTLDGQERRLDASMLVIADPGRATAVAGVMGGAGSEIRESTADVLLESAAFNRASIRATAKTLGLNTESSHRFARGVDVGGVDQASRRAMRLMVELTGGRAAAGVVEVYPEPAAPRRVKLDVRQASDLLGVHATAESVVRALSALEIPSVAGAEGEITAEIPSFRGDLALPEDLVEEYARIRGLDAIPENRPRALLVPGADDRPARAAQAVRDALVALGLTEIMNYTLTSPPLLDRFGEDPTYRIRLPHPISEEQSVLRTSLVPQLVETLGRNRARQVAEAALFEFGRVYRRTGASAPVENARFAIGIMGAAGRGPLQKRAAIEPAECLSWMRGVAESLARAVRLPPPESTPVEHAGMEPGSARALTVDGKPAGVMGLLSPAIAAGWRIYEPVAVAEFDLEAWGGGLFRTPTPRIPPSYPSSTRDLAFVVEEGVGHEDILRAIRGSFPGPELETVELFDVFRGKNIGAGRKSMAYSLTYRSADRTLKEEEVSAFHAHAVEAVVRAFGAAVRDA